jgi:hypothetical protein
MASNGWEAEMDVHLRIRPWVIWWFWLGVVCGAVAILNIVTRNLNRPQELIILFIGVMNWVLGGVICWAFGIHIVQPSPPVSPTKEAHCTRARVAFGLRLSIAGSSETAAAQVLAHAH